ncbi:MAG: NCS2 family permease [Candidatus Aminicenantes bacterium]|nr:NCS2 family permease [Candidatus Aminicenantes bacterium]
MFEKIFHLSANNTTARTEILAGLTTFLTMAYIIFVNPAILATDFNGNPTGLSMDAAMLATCLAAFIATVLMGIYANFPIAQAPGMGENFFFVTVVMALTAKGVTESWKVALGITFIAGIIFLILSLLKFRKAIIDAVSPSLKNSIAVGIGFLIAFIGFQNAGVIVDSQGSLVKFHANFFQTDTLIFIFGLFVTAVLFVRGVKGAVIWGIFLSTLLALIVGAVKYQGIIGFPQDNAFFRFNLGGALKLEWLPFILVFLFMDIFDTMGTLIGVGEQMGIMEDNKLPRANRALISDAVGTVVGSCSGTSTVTSFIESVVGVQYGGRTGMTSLVTGSLFLVALFFSPLVGMVGSYLPITAPALVIVGAMMIRNVKKIDWADYSESIPAFLIMLGIPLSYNIHDGLAIGFIAYPLIKLLGGRGKELNWLHYLVAAIFIMRYALIKG